MSEDAPTQLSATAAARVIAEMAADPARVIYSAHAEQRMLERGITPVEVLDCIKKGLITEGPFINLRSSWQMRSTRKAHQRTLHVVSAIEWQERVVIITTIVE